LILVYIYYGWTIIPIEWRMNSLERVVTALNHKEPDHVPIGEPFIDQKVIDGLHPGMTYEDFCEEYDIDIVWTMERNEYTMLDPEKKVYRDEWGVIGKLGDDYFGVPIEPPIKSKNDLKNYQPPDPFDEGRLTNLPELVSRFKGKRMVGMRLHEAFEYPTAIRGIENLMMDFINDPEMADEVIGLSVDYHVELVKRSVEAGADIILLGDDYACNTGTIMSADHFKRFCLPGLARVVETIKSCGAYCFKHTDGDFNAIAENIIDTGIDVLNPFEPVANMDIFRYKKTHGHRLTLAGNVDCGKLLTEGSTDEVETEVKRLIKGLAPGGGYIMASSNTIHSGVKPENLRALIESTRKYGVYPIRID
jgi:uroporphyrinogen decarboxylase